MTSSTAYDNVPYPSKAFTHTHPASIEALASFRRLVTAPADNCRVLELGCGSGGNIIPMAHAYPESTFVGIDLSGHAVGEGQRTVADLGLSNVTLHQRDILEGVDPFGSFDYIIAHGVYSWVPGTVREAIMAIADRHLTPNGVAFVSYNCLPGSHIRGIARDIMQFHTRAMTDPSEKIGQSRAILRFIADASDERGIYGFTLRDLAEAAEERDGEVLFHDDLNPHATPFLFHEVMEVAQRHRLQFLCEAGATPDLTGPLEVAQRFLDRIPESQTVIREQYLDFFTGCSFRRTLLCRNTVTLHRSFGTDEVKAMLVGSNMAPAGDRDGLAGAREPTTYAIGPDKSLSTDHALSNSALAHLFEIWPRLIPFGELVDAALRRLGPAASAISERLPEETDALARLLLRAFCAGAVLLRRAAPPVCAHVSERPEASLLARRQAMAGTRLTNRLHNTVDITDPAVRRFVQLLDGTRSIDDLVATLRADMVKFEGGSTEAIDRAAVERNLERVVRLALLVA
jgi:SAM-dependent methyltransferase